MFAKRRDGRDEKAASGVSSVAGAHSAGGANLAADSSSAAGYPAVRVVLQRGVATSGRDELTPTG